MKIIAKNSKIMLSKNIKASEWSCNCTNPSCKATIYDSTFINNIQYLRDKLGVPFTITSAYRCPQWNADPKVGGADLSFHQTGCAVDIICTKKDQLEKLAFELGLTVGVHSVFTHLDSRENQIRFTY